jgi:hypothetical protein
MATKQDIRDYFAKFGKEGGKTRAKNMTPEQRSEAARKAVQARWAKLNDSLDKTVGRIAKLEKRAERAGARAKQKRGEK